MRSRVRWTEETHAPRIDVAGISRAIRGSPVNIGGEAHARLRRASDVVIAVVDGRSAYSKSVSYDQTLTTRSDDDPPRSPSISRLLSRTYAITVHGESAPQSLNPLQLPGPVDLHGPARTYRKARALGPGRAKAGACGGTRRKLGASGAGNLRCGAADVRRESRDALDVEKETRDSRYRTMCGVVESQILGWTAVTRGT